MSVIIQLSELISAFFSNTVLCTNIVTALITTLISHLFYKTKLKNERTSELMKYTGKEIADSLKLMNDLSIEVSSVEKYDLETTIKEGEIIHSDDLGWYPSIMSEHAMFVDFLSKIGECRKNHENFLSNKTSAHLWYIERYSLELMTFINSIGMNNHYPEMGAFFIYDIQAWQQSFQKSVVKDINRCSTKVYVHRGRAWEKEKKRIVRKHYNKSFLKSLQVDCPKDKRAIELQIAFSEYLLSIENVDNEPFDIEGDCPPPDRPKKSIFQRFLRP